MDPHIRKERQIFVKSSILSALFLSYCIFEEKAKQERETKSVKIKKLEIQEALFVEVQESCRMREKRAVINKMTSK